MKKRVIIATNNAHKVDEIRAALNFENWEYQSLREASLVSDPEETGATFVDNARIKAQSAHKLSGGAVLADDSGLEVDALNGAPGVFSSRYGGVDGNDELNNAKLLVELANVPLEQRTARFVCVLVFIDEDGTETVARGTVEGRIAFQKSGSNGFGYDPLFMPEKYDYTCSMAEIAPDEKNAISHRGNALKELRKKLFANSQSLL